MICVLLEWVIKVKTLTVTSLNTRKMVPMKTFGRLMYFTSIISLLFAFISATRFPTRQQNMHKLTAVYAWEHVYEQSSAEPSSVFPTALCFGKQCFASANILALQLWIYFWGCEECWPPVTPPSPLSLPRQARGRISLQLPLGVHVPP